MKRQEVLYLLLFFYCLQLLLMAKNKNFWMSKSFYFALQKIQQEFLMKGNGLFIVTVRLIVWCYLTFNGCA